MKHSLMIEIVGVPDGIQKSRIMDIAAPFRVHCRGVALQMPMESFDFTQLAGAGVAAIGTDLSYVAKAEFIQMQQLSRFQRAAEKVGVVTFVHGARTLSLVAAALGAGFHFIDGDAVAESVPPRGSRAGVPARRSLSRALRAGRFALRAVPVKEFLGNAYVAFTPECRRTATPRLHTYASANSAVSRGSRCRSW